VSEPYLAPIKRRLFAMLASGEKPQAIWAFMESELKRSFDSGKRWTYDKERKEQECQRD
jgi:hypothetical protein